MEYRMEHDTMGQVAVPADKLWGAQTQRSLENFPIGEEKMPPDLIQACAILKEACAAAVRYTAKCIEETRKACGDNTIWGVKFEKCLPFLMHDVLTENDK